MRVDVRRDLSRSADAFIHVVWPKVRHWCRGGEVLPVEGIANDDFNQTLDVLAGIDAWQVVDGLGMRGIASRVQWVARRPYASFTIRERRSSGAETELSKRLLAFSDPGGGWALPALTVQAYLREGDDELLYASMARTADIYELICSEQLDRPGSPHRRTNPADGNTFLVAWCGMLKRKGCSVAEFTADGVDVVDEGRIRRAVAVS